MDSRESHICQNRADMGYPSSVRNRDPATGDPRLPRRSVRNTGELPDSFLIFVSSQAWKTAIDDLYQWNSVRALCARDHPTGV
jgi:hypothetical protein